MMFSKIVSATVLAFLLLAGVAKGESVSTMNCIPVVNYILYELYNVRNQTGDYRVKVNDNTWISWNLCGATFDYCPSREAFANVFFNNNQSCAHLTTNYSYPSITSSMIDNDDPEEGFQYLFTGGDIYSQTESYNFSLKIRCDPEQNEVKHLSSDVSGAVFRVEVSSKYGCPKVNPSQIWRFIANNSWLFALCSISMGIVLCFFGFRLINISFFLLGFCLSFVPIMYIFFAFFVSETTGSAVKWIVCILSLAIGGGVGYLCVKMEKVGFFAIGFGLAYVATNVLYVAVLSGINMSYPEVLFFFIWIIGGVACGYVVSKFPNFWVIITSSLYGSYLIVKPILSAIADLPNEFEIAKMIQIGQMDSIPGVVYFYLVFLIIFAVAGFIVQVRMKRQRELEGIPSDYTRLQDDRQAGALEMAPPKSEEKL